MITISDSISIPLSEVILTGVRSSGPGGQHANKVSSAILLQFDISGSSLSDDIKKRILDQKDHRISQEGVITIYSQRYKSQKANRKDAVTRLVEFIQTAVNDPKPRIPSKPTKTSVKKRLENKKRRSSIKKSRKRYDHLD